MLDIKQTMQMFAMTNAENALVLSSGYVLARAGDGL
jgi:hypothetical protein